MLDSVCVCVCNTASFELHGIFPLSFDTSKQFCSVPFLLLTKTTLEVLNTRLRITDHICSTCLRRKSGY